MTFNTTLDFGAKVTIDGDPSMVCTVVAFKYFWVGQPLVEVSYAHNGEVKNALVEESRLAPVQYQ